MKLSHNQWKLLVTHSLWRQLMDVNIINPNCSSYKWHWRVTHYSLRHCGQNEWWRVTHYSLRHCGQNEWWISTGVEPGSHTLLIETLRSKWVMNFYRCRTRVTRPLGVTSTDFPQNLRRGSTAPWNVNSEDSTWNALTGGWWLTCSQTTR